MDICEKQNLHTHTTWCDGKSTPREVIESAIEKGFGAIGFSGHSCMQFPTTYAMTEAGQAQYKAEINALKREYADRIQVFCGIEYDMYSGTDLSGFDYRIGAVHYVKVGEEYGDFDRRPEDVADVINDLFGGDGMAYARCYFETLAQLPNYGSFDIIAHFDIITKHAEKHCFFDTEAKAYLGYACEAARALAGKIPLFEVNTGAIARGYRTTPYPSIPILKELKRLGFGAVISSDCHDAAKLDCNFAQAGELLKFCGFREKYILTEGGFVPVAL